MKIKKLTPRQILCGKVLLDCIVKNKLIEYKQLSDITGINILSIGNEIGELSKHCYSMGLPLISSIVVDKGTTVCGEGFLTLCSEEDVNVHPELQKLPGKMALEKISHACQEEVFNCKEWDRFAKYIGVEIKGLNEKNDFRQELNVSDNIHMEHIVDILNKYAGTKYDGWQQGTWKPSNVNTDYFFWFPKMANKNKKGEYVSAAFDCINTHNEDWTEIVYEDKKIDKNNGDEGLTNDYSLIFAKENEEYIFRGVFIQVLEKHEPYKYFYKKISDRAVLFGNPLKLDTRELLKQEVDDIETDIQNVAKIGMERETYVKQRVNQGVFRKELLNRYNKCCLCGVNMTQCLIASHIKPWSDAKAEEKLDVDNGLLLCPNHDKLFDNGFISFDEEGKIMISPKLDSDNQTSMNIHNSMRIEYKGKNKDFMKYHRENVFKK